MAKKQKKGTLSEEDVCVLLPKYSAMQLLTLLREVAQSCDVKIDWDALVKKTNTGIENAREYQMLWRHLAYRQPLIEEIEAGVQPIDDDSDLEYEVEASPPVSHEVATEAANCVKILAFGSPNESSMPNSSTVEGDTRNGHSSLISTEHPHPSSLHGSNMIPPVSVQKQPQVAGISGEGLDANGTANSTFPSRKKRKPWSDEEDLQLINAVRKQGEGVWALLAKGEFNGTRTAVQLSQRWNTLKKKQGSLNVGVGGSQLSKEQLATRNALAHALNNPPKAGCSTVGSGAAGTSNPSNVISSSKDSPATNTIPSQQQLAEVTNTSLKPGTIGSMSTSLPLSKKAPVKPSVTADSIQAAAVAAGARVASLSDAQSFLKAAQANNTVHNFRGGSLIKSSAGGSTGSLPPNVHFIRTGLAAAPPTVATGTPSYVAGNHQAKTSSVRPLGPTTASVSQPSKVKTIPSNATVSGFSNDLQQKGEKNFTDVNVAGSNTKASVKIQEDTASLSRCLPKAPPERSLSASFSDKQIADVNKNLAVNESRDEVCKKTTENFVLKDDNEKLVAQKCGKASVKVDHEEALVGEANEKMEVSTAVALAGAEKSDPMEL